MNEVRKQLQALVIAFSSHDSFAELLNGLCQILAGHTQVLGELAGSYRLCTTDTGVNVGFRLNETSFAMLADGEKADASISAKEADLLALLRHELKPMPAILSGRLKVQGSMQMLTRFAQLF